MRTRLSETSRDLQRPSKTPEMGCEWDGNHGASYGTCGEVVFLNKLVCYSKGAPDRRKTSKISGCSQVAAPGFLCATQKQTWAPRSPTSRGLDNSSNLSRCCSMLLGCDRRLEKMMQPQPRATTARNTHHTTAVGKATHLIGSRRSACGASAGTAIVSTLIPHPHKRGETGHLLSESLSEGQYFHDSGPWGCPIESNNVVGAVRRPKQTRLAAAMASGSRARRHLGEHWRTETSKTPGPMFAWPATGVVRCMSLVCVCPQQIIDISAHMVFSKGGGSSRKARGRCAVHAPSPPTRTGKPSRPPIDLLTMTALPTPA